MSTTNELPSRQTIIALLTTVNMNVLVHHLSTQAFRTVRDFVFSPDAYAVPHYEQMLNAYTDARQQRRRLNIGL